MARRFRSKFIEIVQPADGQRTRYNLGSDSGAADAVDEFVWGDHLGRSVLLLRRGDGWEALDAEYGTRAALAAAPRLKNRFVSGGIGLIPAFASEGETGAIHWRAEHGATTHDTGYSSADASINRGIALSADGATLAWQDGDSLVIWRPGDASVASDGADLPGFPNPGPASLVWASMQWATTGDALGVQAAATSMPGADHCALPAQLQAGDRAVVSPGLANRVRADASLNAAIAGTIEPGETAYIISGPVCSNGYNWYEISNERIGGWTVEGADGAYWLLYFVDCAASPPIRLGKGMTAAVTAGQANNVRNAPDADGTTILGELPAGARFAVAGHPVCDTTGLRWYPIAADTLTGWMAAGHGDDYWIEPVSAGS